MRSSDDKEKYEKMSLVWKPALSRAEPMAAWQEWSEPERDSWPESWETHWTEPEGLPSHGPAEPPDPWAKWSQGYGKGATENSGRTSSASGAGNLLSRYGGPPWGATSTGWNDEAWEQRHAEWEGWKEASAGRWQHAGYMSDEQLRGFNTAQPQQMTAMLDGKWRGSFGGAGRPYDWDGDGGHGPRPSEKLAVPEFSGDATDADIGRSARSYVRKVQVWLRCTKSALWRCTVL